MTAAKFTTASAVAGSAAFDPDAPAPPRFLPGPPFDALDICPGRVLLVGAPPASGKTALVLQTIVGVLQHQPNVRAVFACCEMTPADLLARVVARLAGVPVGRITDREFAAGEKERVKTAMGLHRATLDRLAFLDPPFTRGHLAGAADDFGATVLAVDYLQWFGHGKELRESLDRVMTGVRQLALAGAAVLAVSSVARQKDDQGRSAYAGLGLASFRGSAELEFGADQAFILDAADGLATLHCVKHRFGRPADVPLRFAAEYMRFDPGDPLDRYTAPAIGGEAVTTDPPPPDSAWARRCPDAYPAEWFAALGLAALPSGFARFATPDEVAIITGGAPPPPPTPPRQSPSVAPPPRPAAGSGRFGVLNEFADISMRGLKGSAVAV